MKQTYSVNATHCDMRIDRWIRNIFGRVPQSFIEKNLRNGRIKVNSKKVNSSFRLKTNHNVEFYNLKLDQNFKEKKNKFNPSKEVIKENENLIIDDNADYIVLNKKSGISVQGGTKSRKNLIDIFSKSKFFENSKPFSVHRLDKETSGVFIIAKHRKSAQLLTSLFRLRKVHKTYLAICSGELQKDSGELRNNLDRYEKNKIITEKALTTYKVLDKNYNGTLVEMKPITGRKHQLRKQLSFLGYPIVGEKKYNINFNKKNINKNLMLHSYIIKFTINNKKYKYKALLPDYFKKMLKSKRLNFLEH